MHEYSNSLCLKAGKIFAMLAGLVFFMAPFAYAAEAAATDRTPVYTYRIVRTYPHDRAAFTQGLIYADGALYEGTGQIGQSSLRKTELATGRVEKRIDLSLPYFGEGITLFGDRIIQLTWKSGVGFVYDRSTFILLQQFSYPHEGWGITHDGKQLILSDGTSVLRRMDPKTFREIGRIDVRDAQGKPVTGLNELEYVKGAIYANIWPTSRIAVIHPRTGRVSAWIDLEGLLSKAEAIDVDVLNGIAYDAQGDRFFITGKYWPKIFEIKVIKKRISRK